MSDDFDPYYKWLGIGPEEQPANHYRLLGIRLFEADRDVIDNAVYRQIAHIRTFQLGQHVELSQKMLNELAAAKVCLLDPAKKAAYDAMLRAQKEPPVSPPPPELTTPAPPIQLLRSIPAKRKRQAWMVPAIVGMAAIIGLVVILSSSGDKGTPQAEKQVAQKSTGKNATPTELDRGETHQSDKFVATPLSKRTQLAPATTSAPASPSPAKQAVPPIVTDGPKQESEPAARLSKPSPFIGPDGNWKLPPGAPPPAIAPFDSTKAKQHQEAWAKYLKMPVEVTNSIGMRLAIIPPGEFEMGSPESADDKRDRERPQHRVRINRPYYLGVYEATQAEYELVMGSKPSGFSAKGKDSEKVAGTDTSHHPVETVSWEEAVQFCQQLSAMPKEITSSRSYRLPTEAEWEYACRAGTTTDYSFGDGNMMDFGWFKANSAGVTMPVGQKHPNAWMLHDMHGNVLEWCRDWYLADFYERSPVRDPVGPPVGTERVLRGGNVGSGRTGVHRSAYRHGVPPDRRFNTVGFRVVCEIASAAPISRPALKGKATEPKPAEIGERTVCLSSMKPVVAEARGNGAPIINGLQVQHPVFGHPPKSSQTSHLQYLLSKQYETFSGAVGSTDDRPRPFGQVTFRIVGDGELLWTSTLTERGRTRSFRVDVTDVSSLELFVDCPGLSGVGHISNPLWIDPILYTSGRPFDPHEMVERLKHDLAKASPEDCVLIAQRAIKLAKKVRDDRGFLTSAKQIALRAVKKTDNPEFANTIQAALKGIK